MSKTISHIVLMLIVIVPFVSKGQDNWEKPPGGIENAQVVIEKDKVIKLRPVSRRFKAIRIEIPQPKPLSFSYKLRDAADSLPSLQVIVRPKTMRDQPLDKFYALNAKVGYGNYQSPYVLINAGTKRSDEYMLNAYLNHYSSGTGPVLDDLSGAGITKVGVSGKYFLNNISISGNADYKNHNYNIYGWNPVEVSNVGFSGDSLKQSLNVFSFTAGLADNNVKDKVDYKVNIGINYLNNKPVSEFIFDIGGALKSELSDQFDLDAIINFSSFNQSNETGVDISRFFLQVKPVISYRLDKFSLDAGVNAIDQNDPLEVSGSKFYIFPVLGLDYKLTNDSKIKALIDGSVEKVTLNSLYIMNPYLDVDVQANNNINNLRGQLTLEGKVTSNLGYSVTYEYKNYKRLLFFQNNTLDSARFSLIYDEGGVGLNRFSGDLNYLINDQINFTGNVAYNAYKTTDVAEAWHRPTLEVSASANFIILSKLRGHLTYFLLSGIKAQTAGGETITLAAVNDLNFGLELSFTERAGIFVELMNIFGSNYQLYNNYPVKGFQVIGGLSYKF
jgi:hypothetical protein